MLKKILLLSLLLAGTAHAAYFPSILVSNLPATLGQKTAAQSLSCTLPSDQGPLAVTQSGAWNVGLVGSLPTGSNTIGAVTQSGGPWTVSASSLPLPTGAATAANQTTANTSLASIDTKLTGPLSVTSSAPANASGTSGTVSTVITLTAPANATGFVLMNLDTSAANIRWAMGRTASSTVGQQLQPGRDTGFIPAGVNISLVAESGTQNYDIQWVSK